MIDQFSHDGIGWKTRVKFVINHWKVVIHQLLVKLVGANLDTEMSAEVFVAFYSATLYI